MILQNTQTNENDNSRGDKQWVTLKLLGLAFKQTKKACIFTRDGRIILVIRLKSVT